MPERIKRIGGYVDRGVYERMKNKIKGEGKIVRLVLKRKLEEWVDEQLAEVE